MTTTPAATGVLVLAERDAAPMVTTPTVPTEPAAPTTTSPVPPTMPPSSEFPAPPSPHPAAKCHGRVEVSDVLDLCLNLDIVFAVVPRG